MSSKNKNGWAYGIIIAVVVLVVVGLIEDARQDGLQEGREQACARLDHDHDASLCAQLIERDVALDKRADEAVKPK